jgi:Kef-type K+ transport system membrane component KefB
MIRESGVPSRRRRARGGKVHEPTPLVWNLLLLLIVIAIGPFVAERLRLPGILGLLLGGFLIGPTGLDLLHTTTEVEALGSVGLLYLMFVAGLELDLNVFARVRQAAITFGLLTFALPQAIGTVVALALGFDTLAAILIGSLWASHTLVVYPIVQRYGLTSDPAVATTVGATVITDTLALLVLAVVAGTVEGGGSSPLLLLVGLGGLAAWCWIGLTFLARWFFSGLGQDRVLRFVFMLAAFLSAAFVAELGGIEGIVGAFFAGLALNRVVPNGGPLMERIEFFGAALFIPAFLVSVGFLVDPAVLTEASTWVLAGAFVFSVTLGKGGAALIIARLRGFSGPQTQMVFGLSYAQAAATLAATTVGAEIGLFGQDVVNAVVVVIVVSLFGSSVIAARAAPRIAPAAGSGRSLGSEVVTAIADPDQAARLVPLVARIARTDGGNLVPVHVIPDADNEHTIADARANAKSIDEIVRKAGFDADSSLRVAVSIRQGIRNEITERDASLLVLGHLGRTRPATYLFGSLSEEVVSGSPVPSLVAMLDAAPIRRVVLPIRRRDLGVNGIGETRLAMQVAGFLERSGLKLVVATRGGERLEDPPIPNDAELVVFAGGRVSWVSAFVGTGDLVLLPGGSAGLVFDSEAHRIGAIEGVSVAVAVAPYHPSAAPSGPDVGTLVVGRPGA